MSTKIQEPRGRDRMVVGFSFVIDLRHFGGSSVVFSGHS